MTFGSPPVISAVPPGSESDGSAVCASVYSAPPVASRASSEFRMVGDVPVQIGLVHAVDRDQEHVRDGVLPVSSMVAPGMREDRGSRDPGRDDRDRKCERAAIDAFEHESLLGLGRQCAQLDIRAALRQCCGNVQILWPGCEGLPVGLLEGR